VPGTVATMRERRPGVWEIRLFTGRDATGRPTQVSKTFHGNKREARQFVAQLEGVPVSRAGGRTVADVLDAWLETNTGVWAEASRRDYASRATYIAEDLGAHAIAGLSVADIERWHARMRRAGVGDGSIRSRHAALRAALGQAVRWGWLQTNVAAAAKLRTAKRAPRDAMTVDEVRAVIEAAAEIEPAAELALRLAAVAGARRSEIAALRWDDFDVATVRLRIDSSVTVSRTEVRGEAQLIDAPTKTGDRRNVRLDETTVTLFTSQHVERAEVSDYVFSLTEGPPNPDRISWWWLRARDRAGIDAKWRLHDLRHWTATTGLVNGHDVRTVAGRLGHANAAMTLRVYAHAVEAADDALATTLGSVLDDSSQG
jgi:integrase